MTSRIGRVAEWHLPTSRFEHLRVVIYPPPPSPSSGRSLDRQARHTLRHTTPTLVLRVRHRGRCGVLHDKRTSARIRHFAPISARTCHESSPYAQPSVTRSMPHSTPLVITHLRPSHMHSTIRTRPLANPHRE